VDTFNDVGNVQDCYLFSGSTLASQERTLIYINND
jgi:hypothetical protein